MSTQKPVKFAPRPIPKAPAPERVAPPKPAPAPKPTPGTAKAVGFLQDALDGGGLHDRARFLIGEAVRLLSTRDTDGA